MNRVRFAQISDLHLKTENKDTQSLVIEALCQDIRALEQSVDFIIFSGDLIFSADSPDDFSLAKTLFIDPLIDAAKLSLDRFFVCPGNHDISRREVRARPYVEKGLKVELSSNESVNQFIRNGWSDPDILLEPMRRMAAFSDFLGKLPKVPEYKEHTFVQTYKLQIGSQSIEYPGAFTEVKRIARACNGEIYPLTILFEKVSNLFTFRGYREEFGDKLAQLLADILVEAGLPGRMRGEIVQKARIQDKLARAKEEEAADD